MFFFLFFQDSLSSSSGRLAYLVRVLESVPRQCDLFFCEDCIGDSSYGTATFGGGFVLLCYQGALGVRAGWVSATACSCVLVFE